MDKPIVYIATFAMLWVFLSNMLPPTLSRDSAAINEGARLTTEQVTTIFATFAEEELKTVPIDSFTDALTK
jgi:hypothetical protein